MNTTGDNNIYNIPFDQYQRYKIASMIINDVRDNNESFKILEIGANEHKNLEKFLPKDEIKYLDIQLSDELKNDIQYILADATNMPEIGADSFDVVIALDVFEHIPKALRENFLLELNRVSKNTIILAGPFDEDGVNEAEIRVNEYFKMKFGSDYIWLEEHIRNGLPNLKETINVFKSNFKENVYHFKHGSLSIWEKLIKLHFEEVYDCNLQLYIQNIFSYYNKNIFISDIQENCYRDFIVCSKKKVDFNKYFDRCFRKEEKLQILRDLIDSTYRLSVEQRFLMIRKKDQQLQERDLQIQESNYNIRQKEQQLQQANQQIQQKEQQIQYLNKVAQSMRIKNRIKKLFGLYK